MLTVCPDGMCNVLGPALPTSRFWSLMLANVPLVITASLPLRAPYELNSRGVRLRGIRRSDVSYFFDKNFFFCRSDPDLTSSTLLPDLKLTVCSAGTWPRRWPWQCCQLVRCDLLSHCFRGTVRRERSLLTEGLGPLCSETHRDTFDSAWETWPHAANTDQKRLTNLLKNDGTRMYVDLWSQGKTTESGHSRLLQNTFPFWTLTWLFIPVHTDGRQTRVKDKKTVFSPLSSLWCPWKWRKWLCLPRSVGPPPWTARCH